MDSQRGFVRSKAIKRFFKAIEEENGGSSSPDSGCDLQNFAKKRRISPAQENIASVVPLSQLIDIGSWSIAALDLSEESSSSDSDASDSDTEQDVQEEPTSKVEQPKPRIEVPPQSTIGKVKGKIDAQPKVASPRISMDIGKVLWGSRRKPQPQNAKTPKAALSKIRLTRNKIKEFLRLPNFHDILKGCFVKCNIGTNAGVAVYRVVEIREVCETGMSYKFDEVSTTKRVKLGYGADEKVFNLMYISNQDFTDSEYSQWVQICCTQKVPFPTPEYIARKERHIEEAIFTSGSEEQVTILKTTMKSNFSTNGYVKRKPPPCSFALSTTNRRGTEKNSEEDNDDKGIFGPCVRRSTRPTKISYKKKKV